MKPVGHDAIPVVGATAATRLCLLSTLLFFNSFLLRFDSVAIYLVV